MDTFNRAVRGGVASQFFIRFDVQDLISRLLASDTRQHCQLYSAQDFLLHFWFREVKEARREYSREWNNLAIIFAVLVVQMTAVRVSSITPKNLMDTQNFV